jgi:DNA-binding NarL/FixJ family response regulator
MLRVLVADGNETMRLGIRSILGEGRDGITIDEVAEHEQLLMHLGSREYDVVLVDPMLAGGTDRFLIEQMIGLAPAARILVLSDADELVHGEAAIRAGAKGYLMKTCSIKDLTTAVARVSRGDIYTSHELAVEVVMNRNRACFPETPHDRLTQRERQVFAMQVCGMPVKDVASRLKLSTKTVSTHKARAMLKLGTNTFTEMVQYAIAQGILEDCKARCCGVPLAN